MFRRAQHIDIGVGGGFQTAEPRGQHEHGSDKEGEAGGAGRRDEQQGPSGGQDEPEHDAELVAPLLQQPAGWHAAQEIGPEIGHLQPGRLGLSNMQGFLKMLVQHIQEAIGQPPDHKTADRKGERPLQILSADRRICAAGRSIRLNDHEPLSLLRAGAF